MSLIDFKFHFREGRHRAGAALKISIENLSVFYGDKRALNIVSLDIFDRETTALIGPSGCGKSTLLRALNRMNEEIPGASRRGRILMDGLDIHDPDMEIESFRRRFGWVAQVPNPFPWSVAENVAYGARINGIVSGESETRRWVQECLETAGLWREVRDDLGLPGTSLSGGQQQRLCIARALSYKPDVLLMDEPTASLDPGATKLIEDLVHRLSQDMAVVVITHNLQQAARMAQRVAHMHLGKVMEVGDAEDVLTRPTNPTTAAFVFGRVG